MASLEDDLRSLKAQFENAWPVAEARLLQALVQRKREYGVDHHLRSFAKLFTHLFVFLCIDAAFLAVIVAMLTMDAFTAGSSSNSGFLAVWALIMQSARIGTAWTFNPDSLTHSKIRTGIAVSLATSVLLLPFTVHAVWQLLQCISPPAPGLLALLLSGEQCPDGAAHVLLWLLGMTAILLQIAYFSQTAYVLRRMALPDKQRVLLAQGAHFAQLMRDFHAHKVRKVSQHGPVTIATTATTRASDAADAESLLVRSDDSVVTTPATRSRRVP